MFAKSLALWLFALCLASPALALTQGQKVALLGGKTSSVSSSPVNVNVPGPTYLLSEGDSNTIGQAVTPYPTIYAGTSIPATLTLQNNAVGGSTLAIMSARGATDDAAIAGATSFSNAILSILIGTNERTNATYYPSGATQFATDLTTYINARKAAAQPGQLKVVCGTLVDLTFGTQATTNSWLAAMNAAIRGLYPATCDQIFDLASSPQIGGNVAATNLQWFQGDGIHLTGLTSTPYPNGQLMAEQIYARAVNAAVQGIPGQPTSLAAGTATTTMPLTWTGPASGAWYTTFTVQYALAGSGNWNTYAHAASQTASITVTGLTALTSYDFRVAATGQGGTGTFSSTVTASTASSTPDTFDPANIGSQLTISNGNLTVTQNSNTNWGTARTNIQQSSGKWYAEILVNTLGSGQNQNIIYGITDCTANSAGMSAHYPGSVVNSGGVLSRTGNNFQTTGFTANSISGGVSATTGQVVGIAVDMTAKKAWIGKQGSWLNTACGTGVPSTGACPSITWTGSPSICAAVGISDVSDVLVYQPSGSQSFSPPSGFTAW